MSDVSAQDIQVQLQAIANMAAETTQDLYSSGVISILDTVRAAAETGIITKLLELTGGNQSRTAEAMGINRATLTRKIDDLNLGHLVGDRADITRKHWHAKRAAKREGGAA